MKGEITVVVAGFVPVAGELDIAELVAQVDRLAEAGTPRKQAIADLAKAAGIPKRELYDAVHRRTGTP